MERTLAAEDQVDLERLCKQPGDRILMAAEEGGIERIDARFSGKGYAPHRHDTYALGLTVRGVQTFHYRGAARASLPGQIIVLHPDELHDGGAGTDEGLSYRMLYLPPEDVAEAALSAGQVPELPFVSTPVISDPEFQLALREGLSDLDEPIGSLRRDSLIAALTQCLQRHGGRARLRKSVLHWPGLQRCAEHLRENAVGSVQSEELEAVAELDRFTLARQFKRAFGTSPHRYQVMRRLERARAGIRSGLPLASAAVDAGFADQAHMSRHFKRSYGMTPGHWQRLLHSTDWHTKSDRGCF